MTGAPNGVDRVGDPAPLILTALLDDVAQERFDRLRREHFPPARNHLAAHLTLFHHLPGERDGEVVAAVSAAARRPPVGARVSGVRRLGGGVAYVLTSPDLADLRARLARTWATDLTSQDRLKADLHVTVQNKAEPAAAARLHAELRAAFVPHAVTVTGLGLWRYRGGPWDPVGRYDFRP